MTISDKTWDRYIARLSLIDKEAGRKMFEYLAKHEWFASDQAQQQALDYAYGLATKYGEAAAEAACEMYDAIMMEASGIPAVPAPTATYGEVANAFYGSAKTNNEQLVSNAVSRLVKLAGVDTTVQNALRDNAEWAWIARGDTCAFCITLASRGWQRASKAVLNDDHVEHVHANCDCTFAVKGKDTNYDWYDPTPYKRIYDNAQGVNSHQKINSIERFIYNENRDEINARKRAEYAARKERDDR